MTQLFEIQDGNPQNGNPRIIPVPIEEEMKSAFIDYAMSVIVSRALPDVRDGLKPVQRRVLYGMYELGLFHNRPHRKSARIVGEVLGKYHPHGDVPVYETMVRLAQPWTMRYPLVDGQGNFGSIDGDGPAAMRYTEARLTRIAEELLADIDQETVDFQPNFDETLQEPVVLPARFPNLLTNGASGIAVGMTTSIPPHNLKEVVNAIIACIRNPDISLDELMQYLPGPDFPTGGIIYGREGIRKAYETGKGKIFIRAKIHIEQTARGKTQLIVTEIPYQTQKAAIIMQIANQIENGTLQGIESIQDESDRRGMRIVITLKAGVNPSVVQNQLFKKTNLQVTYPIQQIALVKGRPQQLSLKELILEYIAHRKEVLLRKTRYNLRKAEDRAHILEGLLKAVQFLDEVITLIRQAPDPPTAQTRLQQRFELTEKQAKAILEMRLQRLTALERTRLQEEYNELLQKIQHYKDILQNEDLQKSILIQDLEEIRDTYGDERRTEIVDATPQTLSAKDLIIKKDVVVSLSRLGYIKLTPLQTFRRQLRGGKGSAGTTLKDQDEILWIWYTTTHGTLLLFSNLGNIFALPVYVLPESKRTSRGKPLVHFLQLREQERIIAGFPLPTSWDEVFSTPIGNQDIFFVTRKGIVKRTPLSQFRHLRIHGMRALRLDQDDELATAFLCTDNQEVMLVSSRGLGIRFPVQEVRSMGRSARGVQGMRVQGDAIDYVVSAFPLPASPAQNTSSSELQEDTVHILTITRLGYGKRTPASQFRITHRGGKGVIVHKCTDKTGALVGAIAIPTQQTKHLELLIATQKGNILRMHLEELPVLGRATQGVRLIRLNDQDTVQHFVLLNPHEHHKKEEEPPTQPKPNTALQKNGGSGTKFASLSKNEEPPTP